MSNGRRIRMRVAAPTPAYERPPIDPTLPAVGPELNAALGSQGERAGMVNCYRCEAKHHTFVILIDNGVTPIGLACRYEGCELVSYSTFYRLPVNFDPAWVTLEWYRQSVSSARRSGGPAAAQYASDGGLMLRTLSRATARAYGVGPAEWRAKA